MGRARVLETGPVPAERFLLVFAGLESGAGFSCSFFSSRSSRSFSRSQLDRQGASFIGRSAGAVSEKIGVPKEVNRLGQRDYV